jgi:uncharacterized protein (DUF2267 family)
MTPALATFESTLQTTNIWLAEVMERMGWLNREKAYRALRTVLHALRDRLTIDEVSHLGAQLPLLIRGAFYEGWHPADKPLKKHRADFLASVAAPFEFDQDANPEDICRAVFGTMRKHLTSGAIQKVKHCLPTDLQSLWD